MSTLTELSLTEAAKAVRSGAICSEELVRACLARVAAVEPQVRAWVWIDADAALAKARRADQALRNGSDDVGPLHGVPVGIKDIFCTKGIPTRMGSPVFRDFVPETSAAAVQCLERSGALVVGKTVTSEFASQQPRETHNPWNLAFSPGGSSSGSAAAVACGFVPAALASQTRGSTIKPAAYCGVIGYKPSFGLVSRTGMHELSGSLDHVGFIARELDDLSLLLDSCANHDPSDAASIPDADRGPRIDRRGHPKEPLRFAVVRTAMWDRADAAQRMAFEKSVTALANGEAILEDLTLSPLLERTHEIILTIHRAEMAANFRELQRHHGDQISERFNSMIAEGCAIPAVNYLDALATQRAMFADIAQIFSRFDAIVTPSATGEPPSGIAMGDATFNSYWTLCRTPCVTIPVELGPQGLPLGLQIVGRYLQDRELIAIAKWCRERVPRLLGSPKAEQFTEDLEAAGGRA